MPGIELRPRSGTEIVDAAFQLYRRHFSALITITAITMTPLIALNLVLTGGDPTIQAARPGLTILLVVLAWIFGTLAEASVVVAVSESVLQGVMDAAAALRKTMRRIVTVMIAAWLKWFIVLFSVGIAFAFTGIVIAIIAPRVVQAGAATPGMAVAFLFGFVLLIAAALVGLFYYACYFAVPATVMIENIGAAAGLRRSRALSKGLRRKILSTLGTPMLIFLVLQVVIGGISQALPVPSAVALVLQQGVAILFSPIISIIATLLYYDARIRNEGFDLEVMSAELGEPATTTTPGA